MENNSRPLQSVGWREEADFPDWGIRRVKVKVDTGARTSALDVSSYDLREVPGEGLIAVLRLELHRNRAGRVKVVHVPVLRMVAVRSSIGIQEERPLIQTRLKLGDVIKIVELTVTNRAQMKFPVILGRKALAGDFVVDVSRKNLLRK